MLKDKEKYECIWYSEAIRKRDLVESLTDQMPVKKQNK